MNFSDLIFSKKEKFYKMGTYIFKEQEIGKEMYFVELGKVKIIRQLGTVEMKLAYLTPGDFFGEMSLITGKKRVASAKAVTDCRLYTMDKKTLEKNLSKNLDFTREIIETLVHRIEDTNTNLQNHALKAFRMVEQHTTTG